MMSPDVSVVVCTKDSSRTLRRCLESVRKNNPLEVIIVDGMSGDNTLEIASEFTRNIFSDGGRGLGHARQLGVNVSRANYIGFIDSDVTLPDNFLTRMLDELAEKGYSGIHSQIKPERCTTYWEWAESVDFDLEFNKPGKKDYINAQAAIFDKRVIERLGFDSYFKGSAEDRDLCTRMSRVGLTVGVGTSVAYHLHKSTIRECLSQMIWYGRGLARLGRKYRSVSVFCEPLLAIAYGFSIWIKHHLGRMFPYWVMTSLGMGIGIGLGLWETRNDRSSGARQ
jgi:glycosyltransferase involved in cell wall biosynthesis